MDRKIMHEFILNQAQNLGYVKSKNLWICCPFHKENTPSLGVNLENENVPVGTFHCLAPETKVLTYEGIKKIRDIIERDVYIIDANKDWVKTKFKSYGINRLYKINLTRNTKTKTVYATKEHRWFVKHYTKEKTTEQLKKGMYLIGKITEYKNKKINKFNANWKVLSVEKTNRIEEVYCCRVPTTNSFLLAGNLLTGNCFGCCESGNWNKLANKLNLKQIKQNNIYKREASLTISEDDKINLGLESKKENSYKVKWSKNKKWREIKGKLLNKLDCKMKYVENSKSSSVVLEIPVKINETTVGFINCKLEKNKGEASYFYSKGKNWVKKSLFPVDYVAKMNKDYLVLVEGPRDALKLLQNEVPALSILGSAWSEYKQDIVLSLEPKIVIIATDPDKAGNKARKKIRDGLSNNVDKIIHKRFNEGSDPADMSCKDIKLMKQKIENKLKYL